MQRFVVIHLGSWPGTDIFGLIPVQVCHVEQLGTELCQNPGDGHKSLSVTYWCTWTAWYHWHRRKILLECSECAGIVSFHHFVGAIYSYVVFCDQTLQSTSAWSEGNMILQNVRNHLASNTASHPKNLNPQYWRCFHIYDRNQRTLCRRQAHAVISHLWTFISEIL
jgi:hypothetical protein